MGQVDGKVAIVTGGASGIGAACAATLAREGAKVVITDIDDAGAQAVVGKIAAAGGEAICLHQDVSLEKEWPGVIEAIERRFGQLNVMMANAGIGILCKAIEMSLADWRRQTAINLDGVFLSVKYAVPPCAGREAARSSSRPRSSVFADRQVWPAIALPKEACACSPKPSQWSARRKATGSGSTRSHPGVIDTPIWTKISSSAGRNAPI